MLARVQVCLLGLGVFLDYGFAPGLDPVFRGLPAPLGAETRYCHLSEKMAHNTCINGNWTSFPKMWWVKVKVGCQQSVLLLSEMDG